MRRFIGFCLVAVLYENSIWRTDERTQNIRLDSIKRSRTLKKDENLLTIGGCGGCSKIIPDRDEVGTEEEFIKYLGKRKVSIFQFDNKAEFLEELENA